LTSNTEAAFTERCPSNTIWLLSSRACKGVHLAENGMPLIDAGDGMQLYCAVDDFLWPWDRTMPVVLEHGFTRHGVFWNPWVPLLCGERRVYRPDVRGFGRSTVPPDGFKYTIEILLADAVRVLDHFGIDRVHWVGESSGGTLGMGLAATHPDRVASLVVMDAPSKPYEDPTTGEDNRLDTGSVQEAVLKYGVEEWCRRTLWRRLDLNRATPQLQDWYCKESGKNSARSAAGWSDVNTVLDLNPILPQIKAPTLIMAGADSPIVGKQQKAMADRIPGARLDLFEGYGHGLSLIATEECVRRVQAFWRDVEGHHGEAVAASVQAAC
jgi:3-oxoadipate enol-lactonase